MLHQERTIPIQSINQVIEMGDGIFNENEQQLIFLKNCLYYLQEGIRVEQAINMAFVDYLIDV